MSAVARLALLGTVVIVLAGCVERMFFYPDAVTYTTPAQLGVKVEDIHVVSGDRARLHGWFMPAVGQAKATVLHLHGNAANISNHLPLVAWLPARGYNVLMIDYRGFGRSEGKPSLDGIVDDAAAALTYLRTRPDLDATRLIVFGQSIGGATALRLLARDADGVRLAVIDSAFTSYRGIAREATAGGPLGPVAALAAGVLPGFDKDPITALKSIRLPLIFVHGARDSIIAAVNSEQLHAAAPGSQHWSVPDAMHIMALAQPGSWREKLVQAMDEAVR
ncbi:MAG: alpha/beta hydrolase [Pseudomonadota bacterium]|nr:alpha/beta hydrolase [Burkholderiaceae bacterium]MDQ3445788.1 alpha/beta hydrolase [Pseudomonadota bacterium]